MVAISSGSPIRPMGIAATVRLNTSALARCRVNRRAGAKPIPPADAAPVTSATLFSRLIMTCRAHPLFDGPMVPEGAGRATSASQRDAGT